MSTDWTSPTWRRNSRLEQPRAEAVGQHDEAVRIAYQELLSPTLDQAGAGLVESGRQKLLVRDPHGLVMLADGLRPGLL